MFVYEAICYDLNGQTIDYFTQWDTNQKIVIRLEGCGDDYHIESGELQTVPEVHFTNIKRDTALAVKATLDGNDIVVDVPNLILEEPYPVLIYVWYTNKEYPNSQSTIARTEIAVRQKNKPHDYYYVENITTVTAEMIKQEVLDAVTDDFTVRFEGMEDKVVQRAIDESGLADASDRLDKVEKTIYGDNNIEDDNGLVGDIEDLQTNVKDLQTNVVELQTKAETEKKVFRVEENTLHAENVDVKENLIIGKWIWFDNEDESLSLKWVGGDA